MARYLPKTTPGDNLRDLFAKLVQMTSSALGSSSIDWDDDGDDGESLDITVSDSTVAKYGHWGDAHGFLVIGGGTGWRTVQEDAQVRADAAEADAKAYADGLNSALDGRMDTAESDINSLQASRTAHAARLSLIEDYLAANPIGGVPPPWA